MTRGITAIFISALIFCTAVPTGEVNAQGGIIILEKFEQCPDKLNLPNAFRGTKPTRLGLNDVAINGNIVIGQAVQAPASLKVVLIKCASKDAPDTCEYYSTYSHNNFCQLLEQDNMPWSPFMEHTTLPKSCPINKGNYSINGARISFAYIPNLPMFHGYWKIRSTGKSFGGVIWHCAVGELSFRDESRKRSKGKHKGIV